MTAVSARGWLLAFFDIQSAESRELEKNLTEKNNGNNAEIFEFVVTKVTTFIMERWLLLFKNKYINFLNKGKIYFTHG